MYINITFIGTGKPKNACDSFYGDIRFIAVIWNRARDISMVCMWLLMYQMAVGSSVLDHRRGLGLGPRSNMKRLWKPWVDWATQDRGVWDQARKNQPSFRAGLEEQLRRRTMVQNISARDQHAVAWEKNAGRPQKKRFPKGWGAVYSVRLYYGNKDRGWGLVSAAGNRDKQRATRCRGGDICQMAESWRMREGKVMINVL